MPNDVQELLNLFEDADTVAHTSDSDGREFKLDSASQTEADYSPAPARSADALAFEHAEVGSPAAGRPAANESCEGDSPVGPPALDTRGSSQEVPPPHPAAGVGSDSDANMDAAPAAPSEAARRLNQQRRLRLVPVRPVLGWLWTGR